MTAKFFVDTNVLLYAGSNAADDHGKRQAARALLTSGHRSLRASGPRVYSEDLNAGQSYDGLIVINPFAAASP
jgi:predicted nucleic acid-binding protein